jgi:uncharacterized membrane protein YdbT with pleckstrin-like domain
MRIGTEEDLCLNGVAMSARSSESSASEVVLWKGHTSQWVNFWFYVFCFLLAAGCVAAAVVTAGLTLVGLLVSTILAAIRWLVTKTTVYELTSQRFKTRRGILNRKLDELELFRVKDYSMEQPLFLRVLRLGNLTLMTSDVSTPTLILRAIPEVEDVREKLRNAVQAERERRRVRPLDVVGGEDDGDVF